LREELTETHVHRQPAGAGQVELSVVTVTPDGLAALDSTLAALRMQSASERLELVVVAPQELPADPASLEGFASAKFVAYGQIETLGHAIAAGVRAASGPLVAYAEEHSFPDPGWAATLIERHRGPWAAVAWSLENANPNSTTSWAHLLTDFGPAVAPVPSGERRGTLPWHHVSYKREELVGYGDRLGEMLDAEGILHSDLLARGRRLYIEGTIGSRHFNVSRARSRLKSHYYEGRRFGSARAGFEAWSPSRRLAYALAFPLVPLVRLKRLLPDLRRVPIAFASRPGLIPLIALGLTVDAFGEAVGYLWGPGRSGQLMLTIELERARYMSAADTAATGGSSAPATAR
jgi:hypothetical protein